MFTILLTLSIGIITPAFADTAMSSSNSSPAKQIAMGVDPENVMCYDERVLLIKNNGIPICVKPTSVERFVSMGSMVVDMTDTVDEMMGDNMMKEEEMMEDSMMKEKMEKEMMDDSMNKEKMKDDVKAEESMRGEEVMEDNENMMRDNMMDMTESDYIVSMTVFTDRFATMKEEVKAATNFAIDAYDENGGDALNAITEGAKTYDSEMPYVFVVDFKTMTIEAHGAMQDQVGALATPLESGGKTFDDIKLELEENKSTWVKYMWINPDTGYNQTKKSYLALHEGHIFGSGFYLSDLEANMMHAMWIASKAVEMYENNGTDAFTMINESAEQYMAEDLYQFVGEIETHKIVAHGANKTKVGGESTILSGKANKPLEQILAESKMNNGTWISYVFNNPETGQDEIKLSWVTVRENYLFGTGFYPDQHLTSKINAMMSTDMALAMYAANGTDAFADITALNIDDEWYPFVFDAKTALELADGSILNRTGQTIWNQYDLNAAIGGVKDTLDAGQGAFITYVFLNPETEEQQAKKSWIVKHDGYIFGAGLYLTGEWASKAEAKWSVNTIIETYKDVGDNIIDTINAMNSNYTSYPFMLDSELVVVANGANQTFVGKDLFELIAPDKSKEQIKNELASKKAKSWISYTFEHPETGEDAQKRSLLKMHEKYVFGAGYYFQDDDSMKTK